MRNIETLSGAVVYFQNLGYTANLQLRFDKLEDPQTDEAYFPDDFDINETMRFEGLTNPDDNSILFAITTKQGVKGLVTMAYGADADPISIDMIEKFQLPNKSRL